MARRQRDDVTEHREADDLSKDKDATETLSTHGDERRLKVILSSDLEELQPY
jgi:hypothetical protein